MNTHQKNAGQNVVIPLMKSTFAHEEKTRKALAEFISTADRLSMGKECQEYEAQWQQWHECKHAVLVSNGSAANLVLIQALLNLGRLKPGDRVGFSALTWATNVMPLIQLGLVPVAIDCERETLNVSARTLSEHADALDAFFLTNVLGFCDKLDEVEALCNEKNILLIEDNCESLGSRHAGKLLGNFGVASTCSFFVGHHLSTIEGGVICTNDDELRDMLIMVRAHGWDRNLAPDTQQAMRKKEGIDDFSARYTFYDLAYNCRPTEITGFLGKTQLPLLDESIQKRERNFEAFQRAVEAKPDDYYALDVTHMNLVSNFAMPMLCTSKAVLEATITRFQEAGVEVRPVIAGDITQHPFFKKYCSETYDCPNAALAHTQGFYFPNHPELTTEEVEMLCSLL